MLPAKSRDPDVSSGEVIGGGFYVPNTVALPYLKRLRTGLQAKGINMPLMGSCNVGDSNPCYRRERAKLTSGGVSALSGFVI